MKDFFKKIESNSISYVKFLRIFLLILIIIGIILIFNQKFWVPKLVDYIISFEKDKYLVVESDIKNLSNYKNIKYLIDNQDVFLKNGMQKMKLHQIPIQKL